MTDPAPYRPPMSWEERARRAEALGQDLSDALRLAARWHCKGDPSTDDAQAAAMRAFYAIERWTAHRADLDTLEQNA